MNTNILYLPLDERPCNFQFAADICQISQKYHLIVPPKSMLGDKKKPAEFSAIEQFLVENIKDVAACVLSLDMLLYGGIVPSRLHYEKEEELTHRLSLLQMLKQLNPTVKIFAFALIMRCPNYSSDDEEPAYYQLCGREIFLTGQIKHKLQLGLVSNELGERMLAKYAKKTSVWLADYENRRKKNLSILYRVIEETHGAIDYLVMPQDDSAEYGYTSMDREKLCAFMQENGYEIPMYPGADEVGMVLLMRAVCALEQVKPKIYVVYPAEACQEITPLYEDRPIKKTLPCQIEASGCEQTLQKEKCDVVLYLNYPTLSPVGIGEVPTEGYAARNLPAFVDKIVNDLRESNLQTCQQNGNGERENLPSEGGLDRQKAVALADGAYCNGGDEELLKMLAKRVSLFQLSAYAGWNTSSNTLGTAISAGVFTFLFGRNAESKRFLAKRLIEDMGYCGYVRGYLCKEVLPKTRFSYFYAEEKNGEVAAMVQAALQEYMGQNFAEVMEHYKIIKCEMPWRRMFEVDLEVAERDAGSSNI